MSTSLRLAAAAAALLTTTLLMAGCAAEPSDSTAEPDPTPAPTDLALDAAWLDEGRMVAVVTWGSSSCVPVAEEITAEGQTVSVTLTEGDADQACTADLVARASLVPLPEGVDPTQDVELVVTLGSVTDDTDLDGNSSLTGIPGEPTEYLPTAGWFDDGALVLLTWGSSGCPPIVDSVEASGGAGTVNFVTEDRVCTMDMAPRATIIDFGELDDDAEDSFVLTLVGDNLDATLDVVEG